MSSQEAKQPKASRQARGNSPEAQLQTWLRSRARLAPNLLALSPPWVREVFDHAWAPMQALTHQAASLPVALWGFLLGCQGGFVSIVNGESHYLPGPAMLRGRAAHNVAFVSVEDLAADNEKPLHVIGHLIDHHLGCGGEPDGPWLSAGSGLTPAMQQASARLRRLFELGYGIDEIALANIQDYFAQSLALYCREPKRLNVADPQIDKWFRNTLWREAFWAT